MQHQNQQLQQEIESRQAVEEYLRILKRAIAESIDGILIAEARVKNYPIIFVNNGFERITGYCREEVLGEDFCRLAASDRENPDFQKLQQALATGESCQVLFQNYRQDRTQFWSELSLSPVRDAKGNVTHFIGIQSDVSDRISVKEELVRAKETADAANKAKSTFIANMSHELRSPLNAILGFSQLMNRSKELSQSDRENINIINRSGEHLLTLINNILDLSKIEDTGMGIAPEERDRLFEAFMQTQSGEDVQEGTGLGLLISRKFIRLMGGDICVRSTLGQGSTFSFNIRVELLPTMCISHKTTKHRVIALADRQIEYRILVVDDRPSNRILLVKLLQPLGFKVKEAENGKQALEIWETWEPHLIWMDMRMPVMDGYEATKYIKRTIKGNATVAIALTASALEEEKAIVLSAGCDDFIRKPFREEELFETMAKHLGVRYVYDDSDRLSQNRDRRDLLDSGILRVMPAPWREQLYQAAVDLDDEQILALTAEIPEDYSDLAQAIANLVNQFRLDKIIELIEKI